VAKHGNSAFSSSIGSSDVLKALGIPLLSNPSQLKKNVDDVGICFLHAPFFHPSLKGLASVRKKLGHATIFNILGPLLNPASPQFQCLGVKSQDLVGLYRDVLNRTDVRFSVVHSVDGYDEISLTDEFIVASKNEFEVFQPEKLGMPRFLPEDLYAPNSPKEAAQLIENILQDRGTEAQNAVVVANAGFAIRTYRPELSIQDALGFARESLVSGQGYRVLCALRKSSAESDSN